MANKRKMKECKRAKKAAAKMTRKRKDISNGCDYKKNHKNSFNVVDSKL